MRAKFLSSVLIVLALAAITACGGGSSKTSQAISVSVSPTSPQIAGGATQQFTATVANTTNTAVTWSVSGGGTINVSGLYTAPASVPTQAIVTVTATSQADSTKTGIATVTLAADSVSVAPATGQIPAAGTVQYTAKVNNVNNAVTWTLTAGPGSINSTGLYTAPNAIPAQTSITVTATLQADTAAVGSATGTLLPDSVSVSANNPTVLPGQTDQFNATVNNSALTTVTWSLTGPGAINATTGLYTAPAGVASPVQPQVTATLVSDTTQSGSATVTVLELAALTVVPRGPTLTVGGTQSFAATGTFTNGSTTTTSDWTPETTWSSSNTATATVSGNTVTGVAAGVTTITATYAPSGVPPVTGTTALNVASTTLGNGNLSGQYVFSLTHAGVRGQSFVLGSFTADGNGNITGGHEDGNAPQGSTPPPGIAIFPGVGCGTGSVSTNSCYAVNPDGRGTLSLTTPQGTDTYSFVLSNDGPPSSHGRLILADPSGVAIGTIEAQTPSAAFSGTYAFLLGGMDGTLFTGSNSLQNPEVLAGQLTTSSGSISGVMDANDNGTINGTAGGNAVGATAMAFTGSYSTPDSNGRGTFQLIPPAALASQLLTGTSSWTFIYYMVSANQLFLIQTDQQGTPPTVSALAGSAQLQTSAPFSNTSVAGSSYVPLLERSAASGLFGSTGQWAFGTPGTPNPVTGEMDTTCLTSGCATATKELSIAGSTYGNVAANGRGTVTVSGSVSYIFYLISPSEMYVIETDSKSNGGIAHQQTTTTTSPTGTLAFNLAQLATAGNDSSFSGQLVLSSLTGVADSNVAVNYVEQPGSNAVTFTAFGTPDADGRGTETLTLQNVPGPGLSTAYGFYLVSPTEMVIFGINSNIAGFQAQDGTIEVQ